GDAEIAAALLDEDAVLLHGLGELAVGLERLGQHESLVHVQRVALDERPQFLHPRVVAAHLDACRRHASKPSSTGIIPYRRIENPEYRIEIAGPNPAAGSSLKRRDWHETREPGAVGAQRPGRGGAHRLRPAVPRRSAEDRPAG